MCVEFRVLSIENKVLITLPEERGMMGTVTIFPILSFFVILSFSCLIIRHMVTMMILHLFLIPHVQHYTCCILSYASRSTCLFLAYTTCLPCLLLAVVAWIFTI